MSTATASALDALFTPRHIAVIGSGAEGKHAHMVVRNLVRTGFPGRISPINRGGTPLEDRPGYATLDELPEPADCAMLVVPAADAIETVRQCGAAGIRAAIIGATGFAELGTPEGIARQREAIAAARSLGMRIVGPNTNGICNAVDRVSIGYNSSHGDDLLPGSISFVSHSGALMDGIVRRLRALGTGFAKFVPVGNEADLEMLDFAEYLVDDPDTRVIGLVLEGVSDGARFRRFALRARAAGKPVVALKVGRTRIGAGATLAHSSRLAGSTRAYQALVEECGIVGVTTIEALAGASAVIAALPDALPPADDPRLICLATSGAGGAMLADFASDYGMALAGTDGEWTGTIGAAIAAMKPPGRMRNPLDTGAVSGKRRELLGGAFDAFHAAGLDGPTVAFVHTANRLAMNDELVEVLTKRKSQCSAPVVVLSPGGLPETHAQPYRNAGIPIFEDAHSCYDSLNAYYTVLRNAQTVVDAPQAAFTDEPDARIAAAVARGDAMLSEAESADVLRAYGVPMVASTSVASLAAAREAAAAFGYPVVLKALPAGVAHKAHFGLVAVNVRDAAALAQRYADIEERLRAHGFPSDSAFIVQPMTAARAELIAGITWEGAYGYNLLFGLGGVATEALDTVRLVCAPASGDVLRTRVRDSIAGRVLAALDGSAEARLDAVVAALDALQRCALANAGTIDSIDVNPLLVTETACIAVDALIVLASPPA